MDLDRFAVGDDGGAAIRKEFDLGGAPVLGCVARLAPRRGHELLIRGFRLVLAEYPGARLLLVGKGEARGRLEALVAELGLAREVLFTGYRDVDLPGVLQALDGFALMGAGSDESCRAALEAMAAGRAVIGRRVGALPETVLHGVTGLLVDDERPESVAAALRAVIAEPERALAMGRGGAGAGADALRLRRTRGAHGGGLRGRDPDAGAARVTIRHIVSCRGWSSDAYWAARAVVELERAGHDVTLVCKKSSQARVIRRAKEAGIGRLETLHLSSGVSPVTDVLDLSRLVLWLPETQVFHVHRGKEHWLAALANRMSNPRRAIVRTRHIVQPVRPHALNRWLYGSATDLVVTVTDAIRRQLVASGLAPEDRVVALPGGVDLDRYGPDVAPAHGLDARALLKVAPDVPLIGLVGGFRVMKGHETVVAATARLAAAGLPFHLVFIGQGPFTERVRGLVQAAGLADRVSLMGFVDDLPAMMAALDVALYAALESDGMSRVLWEYLASAVPVVATRVGVVPEVLEDDVTALLVPAGEPVPLAAAIERLLRDAPLRRRLGAAGAHLVRERFSGARLAERLTALYLSLAVDSASR